MLILRKTRRVAVVPARAILGVILLAAFCGIEALRAQTEAEGPEVLISAQSVLGQSYPDNLQTFYNPSGIRIGSKFHILAQVGTGTDFSSDGSFCWGDQIILLTTDFTYEGLRSEPTFIGRVSECPPCDDFDCPYDDRFMWGLGGLFQSDLDGEYYAAVEYAQGDDILNGDFKELRLLRSSDGFNWSQVTQSGNPTVLVAQSELSCQSEIGPCSGLCNSGNPNQSGESCFLFQFLDLNLVSESDHWWGYFRFVASTTSYLGKMRIFPDNPSPGSHRVEILAKDNTWQQVDGQNRVDFLPRNLWRDGFVNAVLETPEGHELWAYEYAPNAVEGCDDGIPGPASTSRFALRRVQADGELSSSEYLESRVRPASTVNSTGRLMPLPVYDDDGNLLLFSSSSDRVCEEPNNWPPAGNTYVAMDIVQTELTNAWVLDGFSATSVRPDGSPLAGSQSEIGDLTWQVVNPPINISGGRAVDDGVPGNHAANVPFVVEQYPDSEMVRVKARFDVSGMLWGGVGFNSSAQSTLIANGQVWILIRADGSWNVNVAGLGAGVASGRQVIDPQSVWLEVTYDRVAQTISAAIDGNTVLAAVPVPLVGGQPFVPDINAVGFQLFDPEPGISGTGSVDRFQVFLNGGEIFADGFESGNTSAWQ